MKGTLAAALLGEIVHRIRPNNSNNNVTIQRLNAALSVKRSPGTMIRTTSHSAFDFSFFFLFLTPGIYTTRVSKIIIIIIIII